MCNTCRIILNCLLLMSITLAVPDERSKRDLSNFKTFIASYFHGGNEKSTVQISKIQTEPECNLHRKPGFNDILVKDGDEMVIVDNVSEELKLHPFEFYSGMKTKWYEDKAIAIENVNKLLSTRVLNVPKIMVQNAIIPMIYSLNAMRFAAKENNARYPVVPQTIKSVRSNGRKTVIPGRNTIKIDGVKNIQTIPVILDTIKSVIPEEFELNARRLKLLEPIEPKHLPKILERNGPIMRFTTRSYPGIKVRQNFVIAPNMPPRRSYEVVALPINQYYVAPVIDNHYLHTRKQFVPPKLEYSTINTGTRIAPIDKIIPLPVRDYDKAGYIEAVNAELFNRNNNIYDKINLDQFDASKAPRSEEKPNNFGIKNSKFKNPTVKATDNTTNQINSFQIHHNHSNVTKIVKEKDQINSDIPFTNVNDKAHVKNNRSIITINKNVSADIVETSDNFHKPTTLSQYISEHVRNNNPRTVSIQKDNDNLHTNNGTKSSSPKDYGNPIPPMVNVNMNTNNSKTIKPTEIKREDKTDEKIIQTETPPNYINEQGNDTNTNSLSTMEDENKPKAKVNNNLPFQEQKINASLVSTNDNITKYNGSNIEVIEKLLNNSILSQFINTQLSRINSNATNININYSLKNENDNISHTKDSLPIIMDILNVMNSTGNKPQNLNSYTVETSDNFHKPTTLSQYISEHVRNNNPHTVSIQKYNDKLHTNNDTKSSSPKDYVHPIPPMVDVNMNTNNSKSIKPTEIKSEEKTDDKILQTKTPPNYISEQGNYSNTHSLSTMEDENKPKTKVNNNLSFQEQQINASLVNTNDNITKYNDSNIDVIEKLLNNSILSQFINTQISRINSNATNININYSLTNENDNVSHTKDSLPIIMDILNVMNSTGNKPLNLNSYTVETSDNFQKPTTLSQYISEHVRNNNPHTVSIQKDNNKLHTNNGTKSSSPKDYVHPIPPMVDVNMNTNNSKSIKPTEIKSEEKTDDKILQTETPPNYISEQGNYTNTHSLSTMEDENKPKAKVNNILPFQEQQINASLVNTNDNITKYNDSNIEVIEKLLNNSILSQFINTQLSRINSNATNININYSLTNENDNVSHTKDSLPIIMDVLNVKNSTGNTPKILNSIAQDKSKVQTNATKTTPLFLNDYIEPITNIPPVNLKEDGNEDTASIVTVTPSAKLGNQEIDQISLKNNSSVSGDAFSYSLNSDSDSSITVKENQDSDKVIETLTKGRGDMPDQ